MTSKSQLQACLQAFSELYPAQVVDLKTDATSLDLIPRVVKKIEELLGSDTQTLLNRKTKPESANELRLKINQGREIVRQLHKLHDEKIKYPSESTQSRVKPPQELLTLHTQIMQLYDYYANTVARRLFCIMLPKPKGRFNYQDYPIYSAYYFVFPSNEKHKFVHVTRSLRKLRLRINYETQQFIEQASPNVEQYLSKIELAFQANLKASAMHRKLFARVAINFFAAISGILLPYYLHQAIKYKSILPLYKSKTERGVIKMKNELQRWTCHSPALRCR